MHKIISKVSVFLFIVTAAICNGNYAIAQNAIPNYVDGEKKVQDFVQNIGNTIVKITSNDSLTDDQTEHEMISFIDAIIDPEWISRFVLGKEYKTISDPQKTRFLDLYRKYMTNTYGPKFQHYDVVQFSLLSVEDQNSFYLARCEFTQKNSNTPVLVDFRVKNKDSKTSVIDVITEGVSLIETQRSEFSSAISQGGIEKFLDDLEEKVNRLKTKPSYSKPHKMAKSAATKTAAR